MNKNINFFGLFFLTTNYQKLNFSTTKQASQILTYLKCAAYLQKTLKELGHDFTLLCNKKKIIQKIIDREKINIQLKEINFQTFVPKNIHFSSCHYRVDVFKHLSNLKNSFSILIDLDVLVVNQYLKLNKKLNYNTGYVHDISDNFFPAYGKKYINKKLKVISSISSLRWYGGDFYGGNSNFFRILYKLSKKYQKNFVKKKNYLEKMTDELFLTATINEIITKKLYKIKNVNEIKLFTRYWSINVLHKQKNFTNLIKNYSFLHLPADKNLLADFLSKDYSINKSKNEFELYIYSFKRILINKIKLLIPFKLKLIIRKFFL